MGEVGTQHKRAAVATLGCKVNTFESAVISQQLTDLQWTVVSEKEPADLFVINSCTVTREADRQTRQLIRRLRRSNPDAKIVVTGCYAQMNTEDCAAMEGVQLVVSNDRKLKVNEWVDDLHGHASSRSPDDSTTASLSVDPILHGYENRTRAFLQVQQGCDQGCTFCVIHTARGASRSFPATHLVRQVETLVRNGHREIVLCGVDLGAYGKDLAHGSDTLSLVDLLARVGDLPGDFRIRISSIDPVHIEDRLIDLLASNNRFCPHLHVSMQSGDTLILKRMKRRYTRELLYDRIARLRERLPSVVLSADVMVGFPTETDQQFAQTVSAVEDLKIAYPHVFTYSARPDTPAARIPRQVSPSVARERAAAVRCAGAEVLEKVLGDQVGSMQTALLETASGTSDQWARGRLANYIPVRVKSRASAGAFATVQVTAFDTHGLIAAEMAA